MADAWNDYKHLFGSFLADDALDKSMAGVPQELDREFEFHLLVSNVGLVKLTVPRERVGFTGMSDRSMRDALACFMSPSHVVQMEGCEEGWIFSASPFHPGLPQVRLQTDRAYKLQVCELGDNRNTGVELLANWRAMRPAETEVH
jgi:hypothetical protein